MHWEIIRSNKREANAVVNMPELLAHHATRDMMRTTAIPMPDLAPFGTNPAPRHAALISAHGPPIGPGSARNGTDEPDTNKPTTVTRIAIARIMSLVAC